MICAPFPFDGRLFRKLTSAFVTFGICALAACPVSGQGMLDQLRQDVRESSPERPASEPSSSNSDRSRCRHHGWSNYDHDVDMSGIYQLGFFAVLSPFWAPHAVLDDDFSVSRSFLQFPYEDELGYMTLDSGKRLSAQFSSDYATEFNDLDQIGGRLLVDTAARWGVDTEMKYFQETVPRATRDSLWLGDCNLTFRFAPKREHAMADRPGLQLAGRSAADGLRIQLHLRVRLVSASAVGRFGGNRLGHARPFRPFPLSRHRRGDVQPHRSLHRLRILRLRPRANQHAHRRRADLVLKLKSCYRPSKSAVRHICDQVSKPLRSESVSSIGLKPHSMMSVSRGRTAGRSTSNRWTMPRCTLPTSV